jgi:hypothetical protein
MLANISSTSPPRPAFSQVTSEGSSTDFNKVSRAFDRSATRAAIESLETCHECGRAPGRPSSAWQNACGSRTASGKGGLPDRGVQQSGQEVCIDRQNAEGQPVRLFFADPVSVVKLANHVGPGTTARDQQHRCIDAANPLPKSLPQVRKVEQTAADLRDD